MSGIKNPPPRFGLEGDQLFDYATKQYIPIGPVLEVSTGLWNTERVAALIREGKPIEEAFSPAWLAVQPDSPTTQANGTPTPPPADQVDQANTDFNSDTPPNDPNDAVRKANEDFESAILTVPFKEPSAALADLWNAGFDANGSPVGDGVALNAAEHPSGPPLDEVAQIADEENENKISESALEEVEIDVQAAVADAMQPDEAPPV